MESLIGRHKVVSIAGAYTSQSTFSAAGVAHRNGIPFLCPTGASDEIMRQGVEWVFRINAPLRLQQGQINSIRSSGRWPI